MIGSQRIRIPLVNADLSLRVALDLPAMLAIIFTAHFRAVVEHRTASVERLGRCRFRDVSPNTRKIVVDTFNN